MKQRIITGVIAGIGFIVLLIAGGYVYTGLLLLLSVIGYYEYIRMNGFQEFKMSSFLGLITLIMLVLPQHIGEFSFTIDPTAVIWFAMFTLLSITVFSKNRMTIDQASLLLLGSVYIGLGFHYMLSTRLESGLFLTTVTFVCIWVTDSGAYFVGSKFGKHLLWPSISPKKSIEGAVGGIVLSVVASLCFSLYAPEILQAGTAIILGIVIALAGQLGDLIQSAYKRVKGIKDTGNLLPGHGGVLDRMDSWLIVFPIIHFLGLLPQ